jgi:hypothetical protein
VVCGREKLFAEMFLSFFRLIEFAICLFLNLGLCVADGQGVYA